MLLPRRAGAGTAACGCFGERLHQCTTFLKRHTPPTYHLKLLLRLAVVQGVLFSHYIAILREIRNYFHIRFI